MVRNNINLAFICMQSQDTYWLGDGKGLVQPIVNTVTVPIVQLKFI